MRGNKSGRNRLLVVTVLVILIFAADFVLGGALRNKLHAGAAIASRWVGSAGDSIIGSGFFSSRRSLESQNRSLSEKLAQFEERAASYEALRSENDSLRALVHMVGSSTAATSERGVTAPIVSSVRSSPYGTFLIGAGSADGIATGSIVLTSSGFVVGVVGIVGAHTAVVTEMFSPGGSVEAALRGAPVSILGSGGGNAQAKVPRGLSVGIGDAVVVPAFGQRPIGIVGNIASSSASASQDVYIRLPVNLSSLRYVYVIATGN